MSDSQLLAVLRGDLSGLTEESLHIALAELETRTNIEGRDIAFAKTHVKESIIAAHNHRSLGAAATPAPPFNKSKHRLITCLFAALVLGAFRGFIAPRDPDYIDFWFTTLPSVIGYSLGFLLVPAAISAIIAGIIFLFKRRWTFMPIFVPCFWVFWGLGLIGVFISQQEANSSSNIPKSSVHQIDLQQGAGQPSHSPLSEPSVPTRDSKFAKLNLPLGVSVEVPKNWWIFDSDTNSTIETAAEAAMNLSGIELTRGKTVNLFRANSTPKTTFAGIAINATDSEIDPEILTNASEEEIKNLTKEFAPEANQMMQELLSAQGSKVIEFYGLRREFIGKHPALVMELKRSGPKGAVIVQVTRLFLGKKEISLTLSYRESEAQIWKPIVQYIRKSLTVVEAKWRSYSPPGTQMSLELPGEPKEFSLGLPPQLRSKIVSFKAYKYEGDGLTVSMNLAEYVSGIIPNTEGGARGAVENLRGVEGVTDLQYSVDTQDASSSTFKGSLKRDSTVLDINGFVRRKGQKVWTIQIFNERNNSNSKVAAERVLKSVTLH